VAFIIKLGTEDEETHCLKEGGEAADGRESIRRDTAMLATAMDTELQNRTPSQMLKRTKMSWRRMNLF